MSSGNLVKASIGIRHHRIAGFGLTLGAFQRGADSLDIVDFIMSLEEEFDREIPDEDVEKIKTVGDIVSYIENSL